MNKTHYRITFIGFINKTFCYDVNTYGVWNSDTGEAEFEMEHYIYEKSDGCLYLKDSYNIEYQITNIKECKQDFWKYISNNYATNCDHYYVDATFTIDNKGNLYCKEHHATNNRLSRFLNKWMG